MSVSITKSQFLDLQVHKRGHIHPHRQNVGRIRLDIHGECKFYVLPVHSVHLCILHHPPAVFKAGPGLVQRETPHSLVRQLSRVACGSQVCGDFVDVRELVDDLLGLASRVGSVLGPEGRADAALACPLAVGLTVDEKVAELVILRDGPLGQLLDGLDPLLLEHLHQVLLDSVLEDSCVLVDWCVLDL